jgi:hypothetical protein
MDNTLTGKERRSQIRQLKKDRDAAIDQAKRDYWKTPSGSNSGNQGNSSNQNQGNSGNQNQGNSGNQIQGGAGNQPNNNQSNNNAQ